MIKDMFIANIPELTIHALNYENSFTVFEERWILLSSCFH